MKQIPVERLAQACEGGANALRFLMPDSPDVKLLEALALGLSWGALYSDKALYIPLHPPSRREVTSANG